jgi:putative transposase
MRSTKLPRPNKQYKTDHSIVFSCQYHVIGCPKYRRKVLVPPIDQRLKELIQEKQAAYGYEVLAMEIMPDHVHLVLDVDPRVRVNKVVGQIKGWTAHTIREEFPFMKSRLPSLWTRSKFIQLLVLFRWK